jgi:hypothetical protein
MAPQPKKKNRAASVWMTYFIIVAVTFIPIAYKVNGIADDITKQVLYVFAAMTVSFDVLGLAHRKITEKLKAMESPDAPPQ